MPCDDFHHILVNIKSPGHRSLFCNNPLLCSCNVSEVWIPILASFSIVEWKHMVAATFSTESSRRDKTKRTYWVALLSSQDHSLLSFCLMNYSFCITGGCFPTVTKWKGYNLFGKTLSSICQLSVDHLFWLKLRHCVPNRNCMLGWESTYQCTATWRCI